jgi:hypothetical protein
MSSLTFIITLLGLPILIPSSSAAEKAQFDSSILSEKGRFAHQMLVHSAVFSMGPVGYAARTSQAELALQELLREKGAVPALNDLMANATKEGRMYALVGLRQRDRENFKQIVQHYKAEQSEQDEKLLTVMNGCLLMPEDERSVISKIESGYYDRFFPANPGSVR